MTLRELEVRVPALTEYTRTMPEDIRSRCTIRTHAAGSLIHQKDMLLTSFGIVAQGEHRVINELDNGNVYMIESNKAIDFIGEVTILANMPNTSVTIEAVTENIVVYMSRKDAEQWFSRDINILRLAARHTAYKLYRSSYHNGTNLFYPPNYLLLDYLIKYSRQRAFSPDGSITVQKTRPLLQEELGINVKTLNRTIKQLKEEGFFSLCKGKITFTRNQLEAIKSWLENSKNY